jgi:hypothetical protein
MLRIVVLGFLATASASAARLYVNAACSGTRTVTSNTMSCSGYDTGSFAEAHVRFVETNAYNGSYTDFYARANAEARSDSWFELTIFSGDPALTTGTYIPCLAAQAHRYRGASSRSWARWNDSIDWWHGAREWATMRLAAIPIRQGGL